MANELYDFETGSTPAEPFSNASWPISTAQANSGTQSIRKELATTSAQDTGTLNATMPAGGGTLRFFFFSDANGGTFDVIVNGVSVYSRNGPSDAGGNDWSLSTWEQVDIPLPAGSSTIAFRAQGSIINGFGPAIWVDDVETIEVSTESLELRIAHQPGRSDLVAKLYAGGILFSASPATLTASAGDSGGHYTLTHDPERAAGVDYDVIVTETGVGDVIADGTIAAGETFTNLARQKMDGGDATAAQQTAILNAIAALATGINSRVQIATPPAYERPDTGTVNYPVIIQTVDVNGSPVDADALPTITAVDTAGSTVAGLTGLANVGTGRYRADFAVADNATLQPLIFTASATIGGTTFSAIATAHVTDAVAVDYTAADRTRDDNFVALLSGLIEDVSGNRFTAKALETAPSGGGGGAGDATLANQTSMITTLAAIQASSAAAQAASETIRDSRSLAAADYATNAKQDTIIAAIGSLSSGVSPRLVVITPGSYPLPDTGSNDYDILIQSNDADGTPADLDASAVPTLAAFAGATDRSGNLSAVTRTSEGRYKATYTVTDSDNAPESIAFTATGTQGGDAFESSAVTIIDNGESINYTPADRTRDDAIQTAVNSILANAFDHTTDFVMIDTATLFGTGPNEVTITAVDQSAVPVPGITVDLLDATGARLGIFDTTDASGEVVFRLDSDSYQLTIASDPNHVLVTDPTPLTVGGDMSFQLDLTASATTIPTLPGMCVIDDYVYDSQLNPVVGAIVRAVVNQTAILNDPGVITQIVAQATTDANGRYQLRLPRRTAFQNQPGGAIYSFTISGSGGGSIFRSFQGVIPDQATAIIKDIEGVLT